MRSTDFSSLPLHQQFLVARLARTEDPDTTRLINYLLYRDDDAAGMAAELARRAASSHCFERHASAYGFGGVAARLLRQWDSWRDGGRGDRDVHPSTYRGVLWKPSPLIEQYFE